MGNQRLWKLGHLHVSTWPWYFNPTCLKPIALASFSSTTEPEPLTHCTSLWHAPCPHIYRSIMTNKMVRYWKCNGDDLIIVYIMKRLSWHTFNTNPDSLTGLSLVESTPNTITKLFYLGHSCVHQSSEVPTDHWTKPQFFEVSPKTLDHLTLKNLFPHSFIFLHRPCTAAKSLIFCVLVPSLNPYGCFT